MNILFRCDASPAIGSGHAMRCLALAQCALRRGARVVFMLARSTVAIEHRLHEEGIPYQLIHCVPGSAKDGAATRALANELAAEWIVADSYRFGAAYQLLLADPKTARKDRPGLLLFDDYGHAKSYCADILLNQNLGASATFYKKRARHTRLLLGSKYVLLRKEFTDVPRTISATSNKGKRLLITLGGGETQSLAAKIVKALDAPEAGSLELDIIAGGSGPGVETLTTAARASRHPARVSPRVSDMARHMFNADLAISAGGSTSWELCYMHLPSLIFILAANQQVAGAKLARANAAVVLGKLTRSALSRLPKLVSSLMSDPARRRRMAQAAGSLVDGLGAQRVLDTMEELAP